MNWYDRCRVTPCGIYGIVKRNDIPYISRNIIYPLHTVIIISLSYTDDAVNEELLNLIKYKTNKSAIKNNHLFKREYALQNHLKYTKMNFKLFT